jgi:hypothetical protein
LLDPATIPSAQKGMLENMDIFHVTFASDGRLPLFPEEPQLRRCIRTLLRVCRLALALYYVVDEHLHAVWTCERPRAGRLAQALLAALRPIAATRLEPARIRSVESRSHLQWLVRYILLQQDHHGLNHHPALFIGSCFQDLVGARHVAERSLKTAAVLPRFRLRDAMEIVGLPQQPIDPADNARIFAIGAVGLVDAASTAAAVGPGLVGKTPEVVLARTAVVHLGMAAGFATGNLAQALSLTPRALQSIREYPAPEAMMRAVRVRIALEDLVSRLPSAAQGTRQRF